ncbi:radical SAM/SPASM domain-containing protein [Ruminococcus flavefaciens]|uniref:Radical SAM additional 4Fe4S-binding SPASM domain-containing protein n=1 Tax=Ruminococcus flavefaciens TaxID=1265 RepID=A0A1K1MJT6_RUMFL|nr:radical SAM protein [Ruminococcus flavefaciens]SFW23415.1 radical SAM additional 4Fe4S-binding SPASM domain-containing protein [Ruminococcus flavefaciens]
MICIILIARTDIQGREVVILDYTISITNKCNLKCSYCYERHLNTEYGCINDETRDKIADYIKSQNNAGTVYLFGGEPLLYKDTVKFYCENLTAKEFVITTNGTLLDEDFIKWCAERKIIINMSHDGIKCTDRGADTALLDANLKLLLKYQPETLVQLVYTEQTLPELYDNIMYLKNMGVKKVSAAMDAFLVPDDADSFGDIMREQWRKIAEIPDLFVYELAVKKKNIRENKRSLCEICKKKIFINWDGSFYPCVQFQNIPEYRCGDVFVGIQAEKARKEHPDYSMVSERCRGCEIAEYCRNSCACRKMATTGTVRDISEAACMEEQVHILTALEIIAKENGGNKI